MNPPVASAVSPDEDRRALLSALADGEAAAAQPGCELWRDDAQARATWHTYHLIGDVLRSDDLAVQPARDAAFLAALRERLAAEPTVLAPMSPMSVASAAAAAPATRRRHAWLAPAAVAAGFMAVAGVLVVARVSVPGVDGPLLAIGGPSNPGLQRAGSGTPAVAPLVIEGRFIRDAQLDAYLRAHREAMGGAPVALPGGVPRNIETLAPLGPVGPATPVAASAVR